MKTPTQGIRKATKKEAKQLLKEAKIYAEEAQRSAEEAENSNANAKIAAAYAKKENDAAIANANSASADRKDAEKYSSFAEEAAEEAEKSCRAAEIAATFAKEEAEKGCQRCSRYIPKGDWKTEKPAHPCAPTDGDDTRKRTEQLFADRKACNFGDYIPDAAKPKALPELTEDDKKDLLKFEGLKAIGHDANNTTRELEEHAQEKHFDTYKPEDILEGEEREAYLANAAIEKHAYEAEKKLKAKNPTLAAYLKAKKQNEDIKWEQEQADRREKEITDAAILRTAKAQDLQPDFADEEIEALLAQELLRAYPLDEDVKTLARERATLASTKNKQEIERAIESAGKATANLEKKGIL